MQQHQVKPLSLCLKEKVFETIRLYDGKPSVTSVLKIVKDSDAFTELKKYDLDKFNAMLQRKAEAGTKLHKAIEDTYMKKQLQLTQTEHNKAWLDFYTKIGYKLEPLHIEHFVTDGIVGGTIDAIMSYQGKIYLMDWKTCGQRTYPELIFKYKLQLSKYNEMFNLSGGHTDGIRIIQFSSVGRWKKIEIEDYDNYLAIYNDILDTFISYWEEYKKLTSSINITINDNTMGDSSI